MSRSFITFITLVLVGCGVATIGGCQNHASSTATNKTTAEVTRNPALEASYQEQVIATLKPLETAFDQQTIEAVRASLIAIRTPAIYLDLQLQLALHLDRASQAHGSEALLVEQQALRDVIAGHTWLKVKL